MTYLKKSRFKFAVLAGLSILLIAGADAREASAETRVVEGYDGLRLAVTSVGKSNDPPLLLLHSFQASTLNWDKQLNSALKERFRIVALDLRGHGASEKVWNRQAFVDTRAWADDIAAIIKAENLQKPTVVAASYGGLFLMDYVRHHGTDALGGIVFVNSAAGLLPPPPPPEDTPERRERIARSIATDLPTIIDWTNGFIAAVGANPPISAADKQTLALSALLTPHYVRAFLRDHRTDNSDIPGKLKGLPVQFIVGDKDLATPVAAVKSAAALVAGAEVKVYEGAGGLLYWTSAERFNADIADFATRAGGK